MALADMPPMTHRFAFHKPLIADDARSTDALTDAQADFVEYIDSTDPATLDRKLDPVIVEDSTLPPMVAYPADIETPRFCIHAGDVNMF